MNLLNVEINLSSVVKTYDVDVDGSFYKVVITNEVDYDDGPANAVFPQGNSPVLSEEDAQDLIEFVKIRGDEI